MVDSVEAVEDVTLMICSSLEISASLAKVTRQGMGLIFSSRILQTSISGEMLMRAADITQLTKTSASVCRDSGAQNQLSSQYMKITLQKRNRATVSILLLLTVLEVAGL